MSAEMDAMPGVSRMVMSRSRLVGQATSIRSTSAADSSPRSTSRAPLSRFHGRVTGGPSSGWTTTDGAGPSAYQVRILVHSPASVGASSSPSRALSSVDLPALTLPAMASRRGPCSRERASASRPRAPSSLACAAARSSRAEMDSTRLSATRTRQFPSGGSHPVQAAVLRLELLAADPQVVGVEGARPPDGLQRLPGRAVHQHGPGLEVVPELSLGAAQTVAGLLVHDERDLVDEATYRGLGLLLPVSALPLALVGDDLAADARSQAERDPDDGQGDHDAPRNRRRGQAAEHHWDI